MCFYLVDKKHIAKIQNRKNWPNQQELLVYLQWIRQDIIIDNFQDDLYDF